MSNTRKFWGKYRGTVLQNIDPERRGRLQLMVPDVLSLVPSNWAEACVPLAGPTGPPMGVYMVPPIGAGVWVEFEQGDPNRPVWVGCRWGAESDIPNQALMGNPADPNIVIQSLGQHSITISDTSPSPSTGGIILTSASGAKIVVNDAGIFIDNGKGATVELVGPSVMLNKTALVAT